LFDNGKTTLQAASCFGKLSEGSLQESLATFQTLAFLMKR
jgi:hypothetical protein